MNPIKRLRHRVETLIRTVPPPDGPLFSLETPLALASSVYGGVMTARASLYANGIFKSGKLPSYVISIGNLVAGGTGKTPMTLFTARLIRDMGYQVAVISRGYRGQMEGAGGVVSDGQAIFKTAAEAGDEPFLMAQLLSGIPVVVGKDRYSAGLLAIDAFSPDVLVLDDGFQHLKVKRDLNLVLMDCQHPFGNGHLLPRGLLRESALALNRAHGIILTRCPDPAEFSRDDERRFSGKPVFRTCHHPIIRTLGEETGQPFFHHTCSVSILKGKTVIAFSGLADNGRFFESLTAMGCKVAETFSFPDHHPYPASDMAKLIAASRNLAVDYVVTTAKDAVKIKCPDAFSAKLLALDVEIGFEEQGRFIEFVRDRLAEREKAEVILR